MENNLKNKLEKLEIKPNQVQYIKSLPYKAQYLDGDIPHRIITKEINLDDLVGLCRWDAEQYSDWIEVLDSLHKMRNFILYNRDTFEKIIMNPPSNDNLPQVVEIDGEFYIDGDGKHRLTMAKCIGLNEAVVAVKCLK